MKHRIQMATPVRPVWGVTLFSLVLPFMAPLAGASSCDDALGAAILDQCKVCHSVTEGAAHSTGPNLYGVVGREAASMEGFAYSNVLRQSGFTWDPATLDEFLARPQEVLPYNRMAFGGVTDDADRAAVICALQALQ